MVYFYRGSLAGVIRLGSNCEVGGCDYTICVWGLTVKQWAIICTKQWANENEAAASLELMMLNPTHDLVTDTED